MQKMILRYNFAGAKLLRMNGGFTMFKLVIYIALFSVLSLLIFNVLTQSQKEVLLQAKKTEKIMRDTLTFDLLRRDLMCADADVQHWDKDNFVFKKHGKSIGWIFDNTGVYRICGAYDFKNKQWIKNQKRKIKSRVNWCMEMFHVVFYLSNDKKRVQGVELKKGEASVLQVRLRNGLI
jgi:type II secretory pathway component PulJ